MTSVPSYVFTLRRVARMLNEDEDKLDEVVMSVDPDDGRLRVPDLYDEVSIVAFTPWSAEHLTELLDDLDPDRPQLPWHVASRRNKQSTHTAPIDASR